jgi:lysophospholipase L1-like esterase
MIQLVRVVLVATLPCLLAAAAGPPSDVPLRLAFGSGQPPTNYTRVLPETAYSREVGYGFEEGARIVAVDRGGRSFCTSETPFFFSVAVPEGNYRVTIALADDRGQSETTIKAELRRLMVEHAQIPAGQLVTRSFIVNVRRPEIGQTGQRVRLKAPRETTDEAWAWDEKLTLEFNGSRPCLSRLVVEKADVPTIFILGDSTVCDQAREPYASWGQMLPRFFKPEIAVANHAESGESLASSTAAHRLEKVLSLMKPGDYLLIQYGHNDMKSREPDAPLGYKATLIDWVRQTRRAGGTPVLITPVNRHTFRDETVTNSLKEYPEMVRQVAAEEDAALIDLNAMSKTLYEALGPKESIRLFKHNADLTEFDGTHHSPYGAYELARCIVAAIQQSKLSLAAYLAKDLPDFDPSRPDPVAEFKVPPSPGFTRRRPLGD